MTRLEALCDSFCHMYGAFDPLSDAYKLRNPMLLLAFNLKHPRDEKGRRIFRSITIGYENGVFDLSLKCTGRTRANLTPKSTLTDLVHTYGNPTSSVRYIVNFLRHALHDDSITPGTELSWFVQDNEKLSKVI
jgi:hypothetical protein